MSRVTDHRSVDLAKMNHRVAFGGAGGWILWQPRILAWFKDREFGGIALPSLYQGKSHADIYRDLGCSNRVYDYNSCYVRVEHSSISRSEDHIDECRIRQTVRTPIGTIFTVLRKTPNSPSLIREKRWIETPEDMEISAWILDHSDWAWDHERYNSIQLEWGDLCAPNMYLPRVNVQNLYIDTMGVENAVYALMEWGDVVDDYFRALHENHLRMIEVINSSPVDLVCFGDNLHCATLSPALFEKYVLPAYLDRCRKLHQSGKFVFSHWDGDTKMLLPFARTCGLDGIEAITPKPQGDVTLEEVKEALGNQVFLIDGIPAILFDPGFSEQELAECTGKVIRLFAPNLILGISDEIASTGDIERIRLVGKIVDDYNATLPAPIIEARS